jgi:hypothetical protein
MEGHGMCKLIDRYIVIISAWGSSIHDNHLSMIDGWVLPDAILPIPIRTQNIPTQFHYGFSATGYKTDVFMFGGCLQGGYSGDCNNLYRISFTFAKRREDDDENSFHLCKLFLCLFLNEPFFPQRF